MKLFTKLKDGGPDSPVDAYFLIEWKSVFSIALLKFNKGMRETHHSHAFNALTWFLSGRMDEQDIDGTVCRYTRSVVPKVTMCTKTHRVEALEDSWCLTVRGPWTNYWTEYDEYTGEFCTLTHGREVIKQ